MSSIVVECYPMKVGFFLVEWVEVLVLFHSNSSHTFPIEVDSVCVGEVHVVARELLLPFIRLLVVWLLMMHVSWASLIPFLLR